MLTRAGARPLGVAAVAPLRRFAWSLWVVVRGRLGGVLEVLNTALNKGVSRIAGVEVGGNPVVEVLESEDRTEDEVWVPAHAFE
jgi:hypothetical protein